MSDLTPKGFSNGKYVDRFLLRDKLYEEDAITMGGVAILNNFPAADVSPVRHGRWIVSATNLHFDSKCSACGETFYSPLRGAYIVHRAKYCPNCGAKMDGG